MRRYLQTFHHSTLTQLMWSLTLESHSALTQLIVNETARVNWVSVIWKKVEYVGEFKNKIIITQKPYSLAYLCLICAKSRTKNLIRLYRLHLKLRLNFYVRKGIIWQDIFTNTVSKFHQGFVIPEYFYYCMYGGCPSVTVSYCTSSFTTYITITISSIYIKQSDYHLMNRWKLCEIQFRMQFKIYLEDEL